MLDEEKKTPINVTVSKVVHDEDTNDIKIITSHGRELDINNLDEAMRLAIHNKEDHIELDEATSKRIRWKIDTYLLPVMCLLYCFQFMDKLSNSYASILGLRTDLNMVGQDYSWTGTAFYLGYLAFEFPASYLLQRFPVAKTVSIFIILWGVILCLHSVPQYPGFVALRTILGMLESSVTPAFTIITSQWYTKEEQFLRVAMWFACNGLGTILGSGMAYGLAVHLSSNHIESWKLVFIITGVLTIALGFIIMAHVPDNPTKAWFLTEEEKYLVVERIRTNQQGFGNKQFKWYQFKEAMLDYKTWLLFFFALAENIPNGGTTNFGSILLTGMGYSTEQALLMQMPAGAVEFVGCIGFAYMIRFVPSRFFWGIAGLLLNIVAQCLLAFGKQQHAQLAGYTLLAIAPIGFICILSLIASNVAGHTKKVTTNAIFLIGYCTGNLIGPQTFIATQAPQYTGAKLAIVICGVISVILLATIWVSYIWENQHKEKLNLAEFDEFENSEFADLTDKENPHFRYAT